jgi:serine/threonine protein kinase
MSGAPLGGAEREPTQSLNLEPGERPSAASLALGTHNRQITRVESPNGRGKTPALPASSRTPVLAGRPTDAPDAYIGASLGSYRVIELLGKGGMGHVYRAEHVKLGREVALKLLRSDYASRRDAVARFFQEARTVNRIRHRNIVDVTDFVELPDGTTFIIMELLTGTSLGAWAKSGIDLPRALAVLVQICDGLGAAHQVGVVHRDLKPDNVIVVPTSDGAELVKLLDFGVAKLLNRDDVDVGFETAAGSVIGTPAYMSPEQAGGMVIDPRSDIYSLGAIMYELFSGQPMFRGRSFGEYVRKHLTEIPVPPRQTPGGAQLDPQIEAVILKCLEKDPEHRFSHIGELRDALLSLLGNMVTQLPMVASLTGSGMRLQVTQPPLMPQGAYAPSTIAQLSHASGAHLPPIQLGAPQRFAETERSPEDRSEGSAERNERGGRMKYGLLASAPAAATSRWVWFAGVAVAVGLGATVAIWYARRGEPSGVASSAPAIAEPLQSTVPPAAQPVAQPIDPPAPHPQIIEVRFDSLPSGSVYAEGASAELCRTPCAFNIDLADGGPTDRRRFIVKRDGYVDGEIAVDLTGEKREFHVMLQHDPAASPPELAHADQPLDAANTAKADPKPDKRLTKRTPKTPKTPRQSDETLKASATGHEPQAPNDARDDRDHLIDPSEGAPVTTKKPPAKPTIDPSDTLDPFHRK